MYVRQSSDGHVILAIHVDNTLVIAITPDMIQRVRQELGLSFEITDEDPTWFLGCHIIRDRDARTITISHRLYTGTLGKRFRLEDAYPVTTPLDPSEHLSTDDGPKTDEERHDMASRPYRELVGGLLWIAVIDRPDIMFATVFLSQFLNNPGPRHWNAAKRVLRYLLGTQDYGLVLGLPRPSPNRPHFVGFSDSDWASDQSDRRSVSGYVFQIGGSTVSWASRKQRTVALSSTEAEYMAATYASTQLIWYRKFLTDIGLRVSQDGTVLFMDNTSAIYLSKDARYHSRTKHIDIRYHFIRQHVEDGIIRLEYIPTADMVADGLTKALARVKFERNRDAMGIVRLEGVC